VITFAAIALDAFKRIGAWHATLPARPGRWSLHAALLAFAPPEHITEEFE
jgi:hypothetical protein